MWSFTDVPDELVNSGRFAFSSSLAETKEEEQNPWLLLRKSDADGAVPVIGDAGSMTYVLHLGLGDELVIPRSGEEPLRVRLVATLSNSLFQGELLMGDGNFRRLFPEEQGFRFFLMDAPHENVSSVTEILEQRLGDYGFDVASTHERIADFHRVENTYLSTFQSLGGLGLILGTFGVAVVKHTGFSIDNSVTVYPSDALGLERLARYLIRSPVNLQRLHYLPETNQVLYQAKPGHDRGSSEILDPMEFVARVLTHIPDPNRHTIHYYGRYSNRAKPKSTQDSTSEELSDPKEPTSVPESKLRRRWADLIRRVFQTDPLVCPQCGSPMRIVSFITQDRVIRRILAHLKNRAARTRGPPIRKIQQAPLPFSP